MVSANADFDRVAERRETDDLELGAFQQAHFEQPKRRSTIDPLRNHAFVPGVHFPQGQYVFVHVHTVMVAFLKMIIKFKDGRPVPRAAGNRPTLQLGAPPQQGGGFVTTGMPTARLRIISASVAEIR